MTIGDILRRKGKKEVSLAVRKIPAKVKVAKKNAGLIVAVVTKGKAKK